MAENEKSAKNGQIGAQGWNCKIFVSSGVIFGFNDKNCHRLKLCVSDTFEFIVNFEILAIFEISNGKFGEMTINIEGKNV